MSLCVFVFEGRGDGRKLCSVDDVSFILGFYFYAYDVLCPRVDYASSQCIVVFDL